METLIRALDIMISRHIPSHTKHHDYHSSHRQKYQMLCKMVQASTIGVNKCTPCTSTETVSVSIQTCRINDTVISRTIETTAHCSAL